MNKPFHDCEELPVPHLRECEDVLTVEFIKSALYPLKEQV
jgi:hypothetical protein